MNKRVYPLLAGLLAACLAAPASATYSKVVTFGDSLSDNGNLFALTGGYPPAPYVGGRFSNGPVAVEVMSQTLGLSLQDFAYGGAQTGLGNLGGAALNGTGVAGQIMQYGSMNGGHADSSALHVVWAGPNDFYQGSNMLNPNTALTASANLLTDIQNLYGLGAREFFVPLMPNLGVTPSATKTELTLPGYAAAASAQTATYNNLLNVGLANLNATLSGIHIQTFDTVAFMSAQVTVLNGLGKDTTHSCFDSSVPSVCANPNDYLFWDGVHPTAAAHFILGQAFAAAVPEPQTYTLMLAGLAMTVAVARRKSKNAQAKQA